MRASSLLLTTAIATTLAGPAFAADLYKAPPAVPIAVDTTVRSMWSGLRIGLDAGVGGGRIDHPIAGALSTTTLSGNAFMHAAGGLVGVRAGYDWVFSNRVLVGVEADIAWANMEDRLSLGGSAVSGGVLLGTAGGHIGSRLDWLGTVRGRLGYVVADPWLVYLTGGWAYGSVKSSYGAGITGIGTFSGDVTKQMSGWVAGLGTEYAISPNLSLRAEYLHVDLGSATLFSYAAGTTTASLKIEPAYDIVRAGVTYRFDGTAPATSMAPAAFSSPTDFNWTGLHVGVNGGWAGGLHDYPVAAALGTTSVDGKASLKSAGFLGGVQIGYDYQLSNRIVLGLEADFDWAEVKGRLGADGTVYTGGALLGSGSASLGTTLDYMGTVRGRIGYAVTDPWLIYATGGWAYGGTDSSASYTITGLGSGSVSKRLTHSGWVAGLGTEFAVTPNLTLRAEYLHVDFDSKTLLSYAAGTTTASLKVDPSYDLVRVGVNYKFDFGAPTSAMVAKY